MTQDANGDTTNSYELLVQKLKEKSRLESCAAVLHWDEQTMMPPKGAETRAEQLALLTGMSHELATSPQLGELLGEVSPLIEVGAEADPRAAVVREARRDFDRATKLPRRLVEEITRTQTLAHHAWIDARKARDFSEFRPWLEKIVSLKHEEADAIGYAESRYDALLDAYEPGALSSQIKSVFDPLRTRLVEMVAAIRDSGRSPDIGILTRSYPVAAQEQFARAGATAVGFDFDAGRLDVATHPFCSGSGPGDCRLTTRYDEHHFPGAFFGTLHEAGHGMYEQGTRPRSLWNRARCFGLARNSRIAIAHVGEFRRPQPCILETFLSESSSRVFWCTCGHVAR